jgi:hypothetical protein
MGLLFCKAYAIVKFSLYNTNITMTDTPNALPTDEHLSEVTGPDFLSEASEIVETADSITPVQVKELHVKPLFDRIDQAISAGEITSRSSGEPYSSEAMKARFNILFHDIVDPREEGDLRTFDEVMRNIPKNGGLRDTVTELLNNNMTENAVMDVIRERYVDTPESGDLLVSREQLAVAMGGEVLDVVGIDEIEGTGEILEDPIADTQEAMNSLIGRFSPDVQRGIIQYANGLIAGKENEIAAGAKKIESSPREEAEARKVITEYVALQRKMSALIAEM